MIPWVYGVAPDLIEFYTERYDEAERLRRTPHGRLEFARTKELILRHLPTDSCHIVDIGGGPGAHAHWLTKLGHRVTLIDLVPAHVRQAEELPGVQAAVGDARRLDIQTDTADAVLLLGPLYHLLERGDRVAALREARRVSRPGAQLYAAAVSRYAPLLDFARQGLLNETTVPLAREVLESGYHPRELGFTAAHFHTVDELVGEVQAAGFRDIEIFGVEGPAWLALDAHGLERVEDLLPSAMVCARAVESDPRMLATSAHLLAIAIA